MIVKLIVVSLLIGQSRKTRRLNEQSRTRQRAANRGEKCPSGKHPILSCTCNSGRNTKTPYEANGTRWCPKCDSRWMNGHCMNVRCSNHKQS